MRSALDTAALVQAGEATARELVEAALERIAASDHNAFVDVDAEAALAAADAVDPQAPLAGVPIAVKANTHAAGLVVDHGSSTLADHRPTVDAHMVRRLKDAGCVVLGTTRMPEWGILPTTEPAHGGPVLNPWDKTRTAGGSSGGSAAAVAAGLVPLAHGNDGGGSIRIPAACCGLVGLKTSRGRVSRGPAGDDNLLSADGVLTRTVLDTAIALDLMAGYEVGDATWAPRPELPYFDTTRRDPGPLRIAVTAANPLDVPVDPEHLRALRDSAAVLTELGHHVEEVDVPLPPRATMAIFIGVFGPGLAANMREGGDIEALEPLSRALSRFADGVSSVELIANVSALKRAARAFIAFFADWDLLMTPVLAERPLPHGVCHGGFDEPMMAMARAGQFAPYPALINATGQPAIAVPAGFGADGLPTSVQLVGRPLAEDVLLQVAYGMEALAPWAQRHPPD